MLLYELVLVMNIAEILLANQLGQLVNYFP
jgi:hypothetical protein